ncbi:hypothetical protein SGFS_026230 [Streptomyces graminofaciens]|uniref:Uncharacterized protein n=1 Tax=Streptomyces graminofaciens TaxID=68212 RepID=A0ABN5VE40_9ACTN|nr:hypothetical protein [Streptomyces graminofaciens]BBC31329.1 hypothetical protein SGFS_026230 [Streptomyces graminofaciens]
MVSDETSPSARSHEQRRKHFDVAQAWTNTVAGLVALALSAYNFIQLERDPEVDVALPHIVRVSQGRDVWLYLQPTVSTRLETQQVEVVTEARLEAHRADGDGTSPAFIWDEAGAFSYDPEAKSLTYQRVADPSPLVVNRDKPQQPVMVFNAVGWNFTPGRYEATLTLHRTSGRNPLKSRFCLMVSDEALALFKKTGENTFQSFRDDLPEKVANTTRSSKDCHVLAAF